VADIAELTILVNSTAVALATGNLSALVTTAGLASVAVTSLAEASKRLAVNNSFTAFTGSAEKALNVLGQIQDLSGKIGNFEGLSGAAGRLLSLGTDAANVVRDVKTLADTAAATGGNIERLSTSLGRLREQEKLTAFELRAFITQGVPVWDIISQKLGITVPEAMKRAREGLMNAEVAYEAIIEGAAIRFGGTAEKQAKTFLGAWEAAKGRFNNILAEMGTALNAGGDWSKFFYTITNGFKVFAETAVDAVRIFMGYPPLFKETADAAAKLAEALKIVVDLVKIWIDYKLVTYLGQMAINAALFGKAIWNASILGNPLLTVVSAIGVALASWVIGKTLFEQFAAVQKAAENIRYYLNLTTISGGAAAVKEQATQLYYSTAVRDRMSGQGINQADAVKQLATLEVRTDLNSKGQLFDNNGFIRDLDKSVSYLAAVKEKIEVINNYANGITPSQARHQAVLDSIDADNYIPEGKDFGANLISNTAQATGWMANMAGSAIKFAIPQSVLDANKSLNDLLEKLTTTVKEQTPLIEDHAKALEKQLAPVTQMIDLAKDEAKYIGLSNVEKAKQVELDKAAKLLTGVGVWNKMGPPTLADTQQMAADKLAADNALIELNDRLNLTIKLNDQYAVMKVLNEQIDSRDTFGLVGPELEKQTIYLEIINKYKEEGHALDKQTLQNVKQITNATVDLKEKWKAVNQVATDVGSAFENAFDQAIVQGKNFKSVLVDLLKTIESSLLKNIFLKGPIDSLTSGVSSGLGSLLGLSTSRPQVNLGVLGSADGNVFDRPGISTFAENGPEMIAPLFRGADGKLGVKTGGGGGNNTHVTVNIQTPDINSFRKSSRQIADGIKRSIR
jgi:hypothetical protein